MAKVRTISCKQAKKNPTKRTANPARKATKKKVAKKSAKRAVAKKAPAKKTRRTNPYSIPSKESGGKAKYDKDFVAGFRAGERALKKNKNLSKINAQNAWARVSKKYGSWYVDGYCAAIDLSRGATRTKSAVIAKKLGLVVKSNPSDLPKPSRKYRAKKAVRKAAGEAKEAVKRGGRRAAAATKEAAKKGGRKAAEMTKDAAVWTGKKVAKGGKRAGRKAWGTTKEAARGAWAGIKKGWKENPTGIKDVPKKVLTRVRRLDEKAEEMWRLAEQYGSSPDGKHYEEQAFDLIHQAQEELYPYHVNLADIDWTKQNPITAEQRKRMSLSLFALPKLRKYRLDSPARNKYSLTLLNKHYQDGVRSKQEYIDAYINIMVAFIKNGQVAKRMPLVKTSATLAAFKAASPIKNPASPVSVAAKRKAMQSLLKTCRARVKTGKMTAANCKAIETRLKKLGTAKSNPVGNKAKKLEASKLAPLCPDCSSYNVEPSGSGWYYCPDCHVEFKPSRKGTKSNPTKSGRLYKKDIKAAEQFKKRVEDGIKKLGGVYTGGGGAGGVTYWDYVIDTSGGLLRISVHGGKDDSPRVMCRFDDPKQGVKVLSSHEVNPHTGKWNWHFGHPATKEDSDRFLSALQRIAKAKSNPTKAARASRRMTHRGVKLGVETGTVYFGEDVKGRPLSVGPYHTATAKRKQYALFVGNLPVQVMRSGDAVSQFMAMAKPTSIRSAKSEWPSERALNPSKDILHLATKLKTRGGKKTTQWYVLLEQGWVPVKTKPAQASVKSGQGVKVPWSHAKLAHHKMTDIIRDRDLGVLMHHWHASMGDPIYGAGSTLFAEHKTSNPMLAKALDGIRRLRSSYPKDKELRLIEKNLEHRVGNRRAMGMSKARGNPVEASKLATTSQITALRKKASKGGDKYIVMWCDVALGKHRDASGDLPTKDAIREAKQKLANIIASGYVPRKTMAYNPVEAGLTRSTKVPAVSITLKRTEGGNHDLNEPHEVVGGDVWNKANVLLSLWGREAKEGEQNKVKYHIRYSDKETYSGTYYVGRKDQVTANLGKYMSTILKAAAGKAKPSYMTKAQYDAQKAKVTPVQRKRYADFLKKYEIGSPACGACRKSNPSDPFAAGPDPRLPSTGQMLEFDEHQRKTFYGERKPAKSVSRKVSKRRPRKSNPHPVIPKSVKNMSELPKQVQDFVRAAKKNAMKAFDNDKAFVSGLLYLGKYPDGTIEIADNYERFFSTMYFYTPDGKWETRRMYSESARRKPYTYEQAMQDASMLYGDFR